MSNSYQDPFDRLEFLEIIVKQLTQVVQEIAECGVRDSRHIESLTQLIRVLNTRLELLESKIDIL